MPFGIAPTGYADLCWPGSELMLARTAARENIPLILSGSGVVSIERAAAEAKGNLWYQLYPTRDPSITADLLRRAAAVGVETLVLTVDLPVATKRPRDIRNGFGLPARMTPRLVLDGLLHPGWTARFYAHGGVPRMENWAPYMRPGATATEIADFASGHYYTTQTWDDLAAYRRSWKGRLVVKGLQSAEDAKLAVAAGTDGIIVSNHGGRQFDKAPGTLETLGPVVDAVGDKTVVMLDGGIRSGSDVLVALALGARFVFSGRCTLYGLGAHGEEGCQRAVEIIRDEIDETLGQIGCTEIGQLDRSLVRPRSG